MTKARCFDFYIFTLLTQYSIGDTKNEDKEYTVRAIEAN